MKITAEDIEIFRHLIDVIRTSDAGDYPRKLSDRFKGIRLTKY